MAHEFLPYTILIPAQDRRIARFESTLDANEFAQSKSKTERRDIHVIDTSKSGAPMLAIWRRGELIEPAP